MDIETLLKQTGKLWLGNFETELPVAPFASGFQSGVQDLLNDNPFNAKTEKQQRLDFEKGFKFGQKCLLEMK